MRHSELDHVRSEVGTLEGFIRDLGTGRVIERLSLESRLKQVRKRLAELEAQPQPKHLPITFRGRPVDGVRSIDAAFSAQALKAFVEAVSTVAASVTGSLKGRGPLPSSDRALRVVGTAAGSFGFTLELPPPAPAEGEAAQPVGAQAPDPYAEAITQTLNLLNKAASGDDDAISDGVAEVHPRAAAKVRAFAKVLTEHRALFAAAFEGKEARFDHDDQALRAVRALDDGDIGEDEEQQTGTLLGLLPKSREFEATLTTGADIRGKIDRAVDIAALKALPEGQPLTLSLRVVRVRDRRRYILTAATPAPTRAAPAL